MDRHRHCRHLGNVCGRLGGGAGSEADQERTDSYEHGSRPSNICHPRRRTLWRRKIRPQGPGVRVSGLSPVIGVRVACAVCWAEWWNRTRGRTRPPGPEPVSDDHGGGQGGVCPHGSTHESAGWYGPESRLGEGGPSIGNGLPERDRLTPAEACLLTTRIRILLLPMVQATRW